MTARLNRVMRGDSFAKHMKAETWNAFVDTANRVRGASLTGAPGSGSAVNRPSIIAVKNTTGGPVNAGGVLAYSDIQISPTEMDSEWLHTEPIFKGTTPATADAGRACILRDGADDGEIVDAFAAGIVPCKLFVPTGGSGYEWADVRNGSATELEAASTGAVHIVWKDSGENKVVDAVVNLSVPQTSGNGITWKYMDLDEFMFDGDTPNGAIYTDVEIYANGTATQPCTAWGTDTGSTIDGNDLSLFSQTVTALGASPQPTRVNDTQFGNQVLAASGWYLFYARCRYQRCAVSTGTSHPTTPVEMPLHMLLGIGSSSASSSVTEIARAWHESEANDYVTSTRFSGDMFLSGFVLREIDVTGDDRFSIKFKIDNNAPNDIGYRIRDVDMAAIKLPL